MDGLGEPEIRLRIGRAPENDVVVADLQVNRFHAELRLGADKQWILVDLGSRNGTFLNHEQIGAGIVRPGDLIGIAHSTIFCFVDGGRLKKVRQKKPRQWRAGIRRR